MTKFRSMSESQQFRLCGLAYGQWTGAEEAANSYEITFTNNPDAGPFFPESDGILHLSPALRCILQVTDKSEAQQSEFFVIPNAGDDHSVYLAQLKEADIMGVRLLKLTHCLTKVSSFYGNKEQFQEQQPVGLFHLLQNTNVWLSTLQIMMLIGRFNVQIRIRLL